MKLQATVAPSGKNQTRKESLPAKRKENDVRTLFRAKELKLIMEREAEIAKEQRLECKRRLETRWRGIREHHERSIWCLEWLLERVVKPAESEGTCRVCERVGVVLGKINGQAVMEGKQNSSRRLERRMKAEKKRLKVMKHLESWWPTLEGKMPNEVFLSLELN